MNNNKNDNGTLTTSSKVEKTKYHRDHDNGEIRKEQIYDEVLNHIVNFSFDKKIFNNNQIFKSLQNSIPIMDKCCNALDINLKFACDIGGEQLGEKLYKLKWCDEKRLCFEVTLLLIFSKRNKSNELIWNNINILINNYPEFINCDDEELKKLLIFRNMMKFAMKLYPANKHKGHLLELVTRVVEGYQIKYITGSGEKEQTKNRVLIYEREGNITKATRLSKNSINYNSNSKLIAKRKKVEDYGQDDNCNISKKQNISIKSTDNSTQLQQTQIFDISQLSLPAFSSQLNTINSNLLIPFECNFTPSRDVSFDRRFGEYDFLDTSMW